MPNPLKDMSAQERDELRQLLAKLRTDGALIREKAKTLLEHLGLEECFKALTDPDCPHSQKLETVKFLMKLADMEPKPNALPSSNDRFSIHINLAGEPRPAPMTIDARALPLETGPPDTLEGRLGDQPVDLDAAIGPEPPSEPAGLRVRDFELGTPAPGSSLLGPSR